MTPRQYEAHVAAALEAEGYTTELGPYTRDWGVGGAVAGGVAGAAAGCLAGGGLAIADALVGPSPITGCLAWGAAGLRASGGNPWVGAIGCATGAASYYAGDSPTAQCLVWLLGGLAGAEVKYVSEFRVVRAGVSGCLAGALSTNRATIAYSANAYAGKE